MKEYQFEYTDSKYELKLWGISIGLLFSLLILLPLLTKNFIPLNIDVALTIGIPVAIFLYNKKNIKKGGIAVLSDDYVVFELVNLDTKIFFKDITQYSISGGRNSLWISLYLKDSTRFRIICNTNFCKWNPFDTFQNELENTINNFQKENNIQIDKVKSV